MDNCDRRLRRNRSFRSHSSSRPAFYFQSRCSIGTHLLLAFAGHPRPLSRPWSSALLRHPALVVRYPSFAGLRRPSPTFAGLCCPGPRGWATWRRSRLFLGRDWWTCERCRLLMQNSRIPQNPLPMIPGFCDGLENTNRRLPKESAHSEH